MILSQTLTLQDKLCDYAVAGFAAWTVVCHITVLTHGSLIRLLLSFGIFGLLGAAWIWKRKAIWKFRIFAFDSPDKDNMIHEAGVQDVLFWGVILAAVCLTLFAHRPDADDSQYINWAIAAVDTPNAPLLHHTTMHSIPNAPIKPPIYRLHSLEMLAASLSFIIRIPPIYIMHLVFPPIAAMLTIMAYGKLFRILAPKHWVYGVLAVFVFLCANGDVHRTYGNFSFVRLHQGKGIFVSVALPLIIAYGIQFASRPNIRTWLLLCCAQIAAVGTTLTALLIVPPVAIFAILTGIRKVSFTLQAKYILLGAASSLYIIGIGLYIQLWSLETSQLTRVSSVSKIASPQMSDPVQSSGYLKTGVQFLAKAVDMVFGHSHFAIMCAIFILMAWLVSESRITCRFCVVFPLGVVLCFANPLVSQFWVKYVTTPQTYWRIFWAVPMPAIAGIVLLTPLTIRAKIRLNAWMRFGVYLLLLVVIWGVLPEKHIFSKANHTQFRFLELKIPKTYSLARVINDTFDDRPNILAPESVTAWITTMHRHAYPLLARFTYTYLLTEYRHERLVLKRYITSSQKPENARMVFADGLQQFQVKCVCVPDANPWAEEIRDVLKISGFHKLQHLLKHEIWIFHHM